MPAVVVTITAAAPDPDGAVVVMVVSFTTVKVAEIPPKVTDVVPVKLLPEIVTEVPMGPVVGDSDVMTGNTIGVGGIGVANEGLVSS